MLSVTRLVATAGILAAVLIPGAAHAQTSGARAKLIVTVSDPSGAVIPAATVTITVLEPTTTAVVVPPAQTLPNGSVTFEGLVPGRYSVGADA